MTVGHSSARLSNSFFLILELKFKEQILGESIWFSLHTSICHTNLIHKTYLPLIKVSSLTIQNSSNEWNSMSNEIETINSS